MADRTPPADVEIDEELVRALLRGQHADFAEQPLRLLDIGWDNVMYRLGEDFVVRLPRRKEAGPLAKHEQKWLPLLAERLPIAIPAAVRSGTPSTDYPWPWSIVPYLPGKTADLTALNSDQARPFAEFLRDLHQPAPPNAPVNPLRGVPLRERTDTVEERFDRLRHKTDLITLSVLDVWNAALDATEAAERCWLHGDLHSRNVLVDDGKISGVIDWGDMTSGDVATDLASIWMLFDEPEARRTGVRTYQADVDTVARAKGWAVFFGTGMLASGLVDHPQHAAIGEATLRRICEDR